MRIATIRQGDTEERFELADEASTVAFGVAITDLFRDAGGVIALQGELGAGKTTFTKGFARGLGVHETVTSPTYVLMKVYAVKEGGVVKRLCHIDAYRLTSGTDLLAIGADEYLASPDTVTVVEWPERVAEVLPESTIWIQLSE